MEYKMLLNTFAAPLALLFLFGAWSGFASLVAPDDCVTLARLGDDGKYYLDCAISNCGGGSGLCDIQDNQVGGTHYYHCGCDSGNRPSCQGIVISEDPDWINGGYDVTCFLDGQCPNEGQYCDESQLPEGGPLQPLCVCKPL